MKRKIKGFTLIEVVVSMAISAIVLTIITTFFITNTNTLSLIDIKSTLQQEGENIKEALVKSGTQSKGIESISFNNNMVLLSSDSNCNYSNKLNANVITDKNANTALIDQIHFINYDNATNAEYDISFILVNSELVMTSNGTSKVLSKNVESFRIKPTDAINLTTDASRIAATFDKTKGIGVVINLYKKIGLNEVLYPISMNIEFRNKDVIP